MGIKGQIAWNRTQFDDADLVAAYVDRKEPVLSIAQRYGCSNVAVYRRLRELGRVRTNAQAHRGQSPSNRRGWYIDSAGYKYVQVPSDSKFLSMTTGARYIREHRLVMAKGLGRPLERWEVVHHKNGKRADNRLSNLEIFPSQAEHNGVTQMQRKIQELEAEIKKLRAALKAVGK